jgi:hypothetical protein
MNTNKTSEIAELEGKLAEALATIARQAQELADAQATLRELQSPASVHLNWEIRAVSRQPELIDIRNESPTPGARVLALGIGGVLVPAIWGKNEGGFFGAWMAYPKMPDTVKEWLREAWAAKE